MKFPIYNYILFLLFFLPLSKSYSLDNDLVMVERIGVFENHSQSKGWIYSYSKLLDQGLPIHTGLIPTSENKEFGESLQDERFLLLENTYSEYEKQLNKRGRGIEATKDFREILKGEDQKIKIESLIHFRIYSLNQFDQEIELGSFEVVDFGSDQSSKQLLTIKKKLNRMGKSLQGRLKGKRLIEIRRLNIALGHDRKIINLNLVAEIIAQHFYYLQLPIDTEIYIEAGPLAKRLYTPMGFDVVPGLSKNKFILLSNVQNFYSKFHRWVLNYPQNLNLCRKLFNE